MAMLDWNEPGIFSPMEAAETGVAVVAVFDSHMEMLFTDGDVVMVELPH